MAEFSGVSIPTSLKETLEFFGVLYANTGLQELVCEKLQESVRVTVGFKVTQNSVEGGSMKNNLKNVLTNIDTLRKAIVSNGDQSNYGSYNFLLKSTQGTVCVNLLVKFVLDILPKLYATLNFVMFKVNTFDKDLGGGRWSGQNCNGQSDPGSLNNWLKSSDPNGLPSALTAISTATLLPGGYRGELSSQTGENLKNMLESLLKDSGEGEGSCLHYLLLDVLILTNCSASNVAAYLVVLRALYEATKKQFSADLKTYADLEGVLKKTPTNLQLFAPDIEEDYDAYLTALFQGSPNAYSKRLSDTLLKHLEWLTPKLPQLIASLQSLSTDSSKWNQNGLEEANISGPFAYGFSFSEQWEGWNGDIEGQIPGAIDKLTGDLTALKLVLEKHFQGSTATWSSGSSGPVSANTSLSVCSETGSDGPHTLGSSGTVSDVPVPQNLKEAIDFVLRISGGDAVDKEKNGIKGLANEVKQLLKTSHIRDFKHYDSKLESIITKLTAGLGAFVGYNDGDVKPNGKGIASRAYKSSCGNDANWTLTWNDLSNTGVKKSAKIFLGCVPLFYYSMTYLYWRCAANVNGCRGDWEVMNFNGDLNVETLLGIISALTKFMAAVGYSNPSQLSNKDGDSVMKKVAETFPELREISVESYDSSYSTYIQRVKQKGFKSLDYTPEECPLYSLHHAAMAYWESEPAKSSEIREAIENISETFDSISKTANEPGDFLKRNIANLHEKLRKFLNPDSSESGSDGPPKPGSSRTMNTNLDGSETFGDSTTTSESATTLTTTTERTSPTSTAESATPTPSITTTTATEYSSGGGGTGDRGPLGSVGPTGINGDRGEAGPARPQSPRGDIGDTGEERGHARSTTPSSVPDSRPQLSVSAVQAAGPVAILALGGGGTAAYFLDIGGFGTMVRSVIGSH